MVRWVHIISVGTSLLANFERLWPDVAERLGIRGWSRASPLEHNIQNTALSRARAGDEVFDTLLKFLEEDPEGRSAELNAFLRYVRLNSHTPPSDVGVLLYSTDTGTCYLSASVIHEYLKRREYKLLSSKPLRIEGLGRSEELFDDALTNLLEKVVGKIVEWSKKGVPVYINATGGFKAETQFLVLAAAVAGAKSAYYIHETFRDVVELPLPPLTIDERLRKLINEVTKSSITSRRELEEICLRLDLNLTELEVDRKLIRGLKPRKWLVKLVRQK